MGIVKTFLPRRSQIPKSLVKRVNFVVRMWANPCDAPLTIYVETMWPALLEAFITAIDFGLADLARAIFRPWGLTKVAGSRRRRGHRPRLHRRIQRRFGPLKKLQDRKIGRALKWLWIIDTRLQYVLFWFLVADVLSEFLYRWTSGLYCTSYCSMSLGPGAALGHNPGDIHLALSGWTANLWPLTKYARGSAGIHLGGASFGPGKWMLVAGGTAKAKTGGTLEISMRMRAPGYGPMLDQDGPVFVTKEETADLVVSAMIEGDGNIIIEVRSEGGNYEILDAYLSVIGEPPGGNPLCPT